MSNQIRKILQHLRYFSRTKSLENKSAHRIAQSGQHCKLCYTYNSPVLSNQKQRIPLANSMGEMIVMSYFAIVNFHFLNGLQLYQPLERFDRESEGVATIDCYQYTKEILKTERKEKKAQLTIECQAVF